MTSSAPAVAAGDVLTLEELRHFRRTSTARGLALVLHAWGVIAAAMAVYAWWPAPTRARPLARGFLAPYWVNYHVEHHLLVFVPCRKLRSAHALLLGKGYGPRMELAASYGESSRARPGREQGRQFDLSPALWQDRRRHLRRRDGSAAPKRSPGRRR